MPAIFPTLQPDELFYSAVARYGDMMQYTNEGALSEDVYGISDAYPSVDFSASLDRFCSRLPASLILEHRIAPREIAWNHTMLPYFAPFVDPAQVQKVEDLICAEGIRSIKRAFGLSRNPPMSTRLRYCWACIMEDRAGGRVCRTGTECTNSPVL